MRARRWLAALTLVLGHLLRAPAAGATPISPVEVDPWVDGGVLVVSTLLATTPSLTTNFSYTPACDPCNADDLLPLDRPVIHYDNERADLAGDILGVAVPALATLGSLASLRDWGWRGVAEDAVIVAQTVAVTAALQQVVRFAVRRPRPYMYVADKRADKRHRMDGSLSFFSGHTSDAFAAAVAFSRLFGLRHPQSKWRAAVWIGTLLMASAIPVLRVASGEHFWTDVMTGAAVGTGVGLLVPALHRTRSRAEQRVGLVPAGLGVAGWF